MSVYQHLMIEFRSAKVIADLLNVKVSTVYKWKYRKIPKKYIREIELYSERALTRRQIRPDLFKVNVD